MNALQFNFCHPVKGLVRLLYKANPKFNRMLPLDTPDETVNIPIDGLCSGQWKAIFEWEYDGRNYFYEQEFEIAALNKNKKKKVSP